MQLVTQLVSLAAAAALAHAASWSTLRPNLYFGLRQDTEKSPLTGVMWLKPHPTAFQGIRHACQEGDKLKTYTYTEHDGDSAARERIVDEDSNTEITIHWLKTGSPESWGVRVSGKPIDPATPNPVVFLNYIGSDNPEDSLGLVDSGENEVNIRGHSPLLGSFSYKVQDAHTNVQLPDKLKAEGVHAPSGHVWEAKEMYQKLVMSRIEQRTKVTKDILDVLALEDGHEAFQANLYYVQQVYIGEWSFDIYFNADGGPVLDRDALTAGISASSAAFDDKFEQTYHLREAGYSQEEVAHAKDAIANLLGGIGYFYGSALVDAQTPDDYESPLDPETRDVQETQPYGLFTSTPSRSFFPRGFFWDEGFHLVGIDAIRPDLVLKITQSWANLIDDDGWLGREQILGNEARSRVPQEFQVQKKWHANPPVLILGLLHHLEKLSTQKNELGEVALSDDQLNSLRFIYKKFQAHYDWFHASQKGQIREWERSAPHRSEGFRWKGRTQRHVLTSGIDDYPRPAPHVGELHVDLHSWMGFYADAMAQFARFLGQSADEAEYTDTFDKVVENLVPLHWSDEHCLFCDAGLDEDDESLLVCHPGYISIMPLITGVLPVDAPQVGALLDLIADPNQLWTDYGIASLSKSHPLFGTDENYWRGPIWMPINYMLLRALYKKYALLPGPYQKHAARLYADIRANLVSNILHQYGKSGYYWEQYNALTGDGQRSHPFTGWTALVVTIMAEDY